MDYYSDQRELAINLLQNYGDSYAVREVIKTIKNRSNCYSTILNTAHELLDLECFVEIILNGVPIWAFKTLRCQLIHLGAYRDEFIEKIAEAAYAYAHARWAFQILFHIPNLGTHRDQLIAKSIENARLAFSTLRDVDDLGDRRDVLATITAKITEDAEYGNTWSRQDIEELYKLDHSERELLWKSVQKYLPS